MGDAPAGGVGADPTPLTGQKKPCGPSAYETSRFFVCW
jgi:hypothetical protein